MKNVTYYDFCGAATVSGRPLSNAGERQVEFRLRTEPQLAGAAINGEVGNDNSRKAIVVFNLPLGSISASVSLGAKGDGPLALLPLTEWRETGEMARP
jgi:hypothetical protein